jgi:hypothetical protein
MSNNLRVEECFDKASMAALPTFDRNLTTLHPLHDSEKSVAIAASFGPPSMPTPSPKQIS